MFRKRVSARLAAGDSFRGVLFELKQKDKEGTGPSQPIGWAGPVPSPCSCFELGVFSPQSGPELALFEGFELNNEALTPLQRGERLFFEGPVVVGRDFCGIISHEDFDCFGRFF